MSTYSTIELAQLIEADVRSYLEEDCDEHNATRAIPVLTLYTYIRGQNYGVHVTAGFFNKVLNEMKSTGVVGPVRASQQVFLSPEAWEIHRKIKPLLDEFDKLECALRDRGELVGAIQYRLQRGGCSSATISNSGKYVAVANNQLPLAVSILQEFKTARAVSS